MKGVKQVQNSIQLAHFSQKQWDNMIIYIKEDFTSHMIDLDEIPLCTHEEADTMIFVHTNHAKKGGSPEGVLLAKASDTDIICIAVSQYDVSSPRDWSTSAVN